MRPSLVNCQKTHTTTLPTPTLYRRLIQLHFRHPHLSFTIVIIIALMKICHFFLRSALLSMTKMTSWQSNFLRTQKWSSLCQWTWQTWLHDNLCFDQTFKWLLHWSKCSWRSKLGSAAFAAIVSYIDNQPGKYCVLVLCAVCLCVQVFVLRSAPRLCPTLITNQAVLCVCLCCLLCAAIVSHIDIKPTRQV